tara:strand:+ start:6648 stop:7271 length:624 start_codon:yes stop_codon:yes gene_type:complete
MFDDIVFPLEISRQSVAGPEFSTDVTETGGGFERRNQNWEGGRLRFNVAPGVRMRSDHETLLAFFRCRAGKARGFRFRDWTDDRSGDLGAAPTATDQLLGTGDGAQQFFQLRKAYVSGEVTQWRKITRPVEDTVKVALGGIEQETGWSVDLDTGLVSFDDPPPVDVIVTAGFQFDVPARFEIDRLEPVWLFPDAYQAPEIPIIEIRE